MQLWPNPDMDTHTDNPKPLPEGRVGPERQLGSSDSAVQRVIQHSKGLVEDLQQWVELKVELTQLEIMEKVDARINT